MKSPSAQERERNTAAERHRRNALRAGSYACEFCGQKANMRKHRGITKSGLSVHHIIPLGWGGANDEKNLVILCEEHHVMADRLSRTLSSRSKRRAAYRGPRTRRGLLNAIGRMIRRDSERMSKFVLVNDYPAWIMIGGRWHAPRKTALFGRTVWVVDDYSRMKQR